MNLKWKLKHLNYSAEIRQSNPEKILLKVLFTLQLQETMMLLFFSWTPSGLLYRDTLQWVQVPPPCVPVCSHLLTAVVVLALLLPLPMLLSHQVLSTSAWIYSTPLPEANGHTCPGEGQICRPVTLSSGCQSVLMAVNPCATRYNKTLWEYAQINLRHDQIEHPNASEDINTALVQLLIPMIYK